VQRCPDDACPTDRGHVSERASAFVDDHGGPDDNPVRGTGRRDVDPSPAA